MDRRLVRSQSRRLAALSAVLLLSGCDIYHFVAGTWQEDARKPALALRHYETFLTDRPGDPRACEVRLRAAEIYRGVFGRYAEARRHFEAAARDFPKMTACAERAKMGLLKSPDYFPLERGRTWIYVDSASRGRAMRLEWELRRSSGAAGGQIDTALFAGNKRIRQGVESYAKEDWAVWRVAADAREPFLRYPFGKDQAWTGRRGAAKVEWTVVSAAQPVSVAAGKFADCLKVREHDLRYPKSWRFDYYCPGVGRVKTTIGGPGFENPNIELLRFDKIDGS